MKLVWYREISSGQGPAMFNLGLGASWTVSQRTWYLDSSQDCFLVRGTGVQTQNLGPPVPSWLGLSRCAFSMRAFLVASQPSCSLLPLEITWKRPLTLTVAQLIVRVTQTESEVSN